VTINKTTSPQVSYIRCQRCCWWISKCK